MNKLHFPPHLKPPNLVPILQLTYSIVRQILSNGDHHLELFLRRRPQCNALKNMTFWLKQIMKPPLVVVALHLSHMFSACSLMQTNVLL